MSSHIRVSKHTFVYDCADPAALAGFYAGLLGWSIDPESDDRWVDLVPPEGSAFTLSFQRIDGYVAPTWPEGDVPQQAHLDFDVPSLEEAGRLAEASGAKRHPVQPSETGSFVVYADPAGHLFCLCAE
ncbi:VOC family protein [Leucobacter zeae]|nr:VOC family protein [Leucobacter zeae]